MRVERSWIVLCLLFLILLSEIAEFACAMHLRDMKSGSPQRGVHRFPRKRHKRRKDAFDKQEKPFLKISVSKEKIGPTLGRDMLWDDYESDTVMSTSEEQIIKPMKMKGELSSYHKDAPTSISKHHEVIPLKQYPKSLPKNVELNSPCQACAEWTYRQPEEVKVRQEQKEQEERVNLLIIPIAALFAFLAVLTLKCINWFHEDIWLADEKLIQISVPNTPAISRQTSVLSNSRTYPRSPSSATTSACSSPSKVGKHKHYRKSRVTPERDIGKGEEVSSSEDVRVLDLRRKRPPALSSPSHARGARVAKQDLRKQLKFDKSKPQWGVHYQAKRCDSDSSSGIASGSVAQAPVQSHTSSKELSSPSSLGYVSRSDSFQDGAPLLNSQAQHLLAPNPLNRRMRTNSDLQLARALLQLQTISLSMIGGSTGKMSGDGSQSVSTMSTGTSSTTIPSPNIRSRTSESEAAASSQVSTPGGPNEVFSQLATNETYLAALHNQFDGSNSSLGLSDYMSGTDNNQYFEDPFIITSSYPDGDTTAPNPKTTLRMVSQDSNANSSGFVSSKQSPVYDSDGIHSDSAQSSNSSRFIRSGNSSEENTREYKGSVWNSSVDSVQGMGAQGSSISSSAASPDELPVSDVNPNTFYTIACVHSSAGSNESLISRGSPRQQRNSVSPVRKSASPSNSPFNSLQRERGSRDLLHRLGKFARINLGHSRKQDRSATCQSWCLADTVNNSELGVTLDELRQSVLECEKETTL